MARSLDDLYNLMVYIVRKERGVFLTTAQAMNALDNGQIDAYSEYFKLYGKDQYVHDAIRPFRIYYPFTSDGSGYVTYPEELLDLLGQPFTILGSTVNRVEFVNEDEFPFALTSQLRPITNTYPIAVDTSTGFSIYPQQTQVGFFFYLKRPPTPVYAFIENGRQLLYDATNSVQLGWADQYLNNIVGRALKYVGINMDEDKVFGFADQYEKETKA